MTEFLLCPAWAFGQTVCRLGFAWRIGADLSADDVLHAISHGVNFLNWPGAADYDAPADGLGDAVASLGSWRNTLVVCVQFAARTALDAASELRTVLAALRTDYIDVLTLYYVEAQEEWDQLRGPGGALEYLRGAKRDGLVRQIGVTSHQRKLAARMAESGELDALMIRYNAAHRGAERDVFPVTDARRVPVIAYTALRWGALPQATPEDPPGFAVPAPPLWYRFALQSPSVAVALAAPANRAELEEDLGVLNATGPLNEVEYAALVAHGERVRRHAGRFP